MLANNRLKNKRNSNKPIQLVVVSVSETVKIVFTWERDLGLIIFKIEIENVTF